MTTISSRSALSLKVIRSILDQERAPDLVYLNISAEPRFIDEGVEFDTLPEKLRKWIVQGRVRLNFTRNTGPYRKLVPALLRHQGEDCVIVTADDDVVYPPGWLGGLLQIHEQFGGIAAYRCRAMSFRNGALESYSRWSVVDSLDQGDFGEIAPEYRSLFLCPTGRSGVLYRPEFLPDLKLIETFQELAPLQDDLGFKVATLLAKVPVTIAPVELAGSSDKLFRRAGPTEGKLTDTNKSANNPAVRALFGFVRKNKLFDWSDYLMAGAEKSTEDQ